MSDQRVAAAVRRENGRALAAALGIAAADAESLLDVDICLTGDDGADTRRILTELRELLARTCSRVGERLETPAVEVVVGECAPTTSAPAIFVAVVGDSVVISRRRLEHAGNLHSLHPVLALLGACYIAAAAVRLISGDRVGNPWNDPLHIDFKELDVDLQMLHRQIDLGEAYLAGAGAVGNGLLWAMRHLNVCGRLHVVDDDSVSDGNLNRQMWFLEGDIDLPKAEVLAEKAADHLPGLSLVPHVARLEELGQGRLDAWLKRLIVAVDSRRARRRLQDEMPGEVFDASTTDIREVVVHHHRQPTDGACLACIYELNEAEQSREQHIADHLGVTIEALSEERISAQSAGVIAKRFRNQGLRASDIEGMAFDSLFKQLCGAGALMTPTGRQVIAPLAFVSVLAGTLLALELVRVLVPESSTIQSNYWKASCWAPFKKRLRRMRGRRATCKVCGDPIRARIRAQLWS